MYPDSVATLGIDVKKVGTHSSPLLAPPLSRMMLGRKAGKRRVSALLPIQDHSKLCLALCKDLILGFVSML